MDSLDCMLSKELIVNKITPNFFKWEDFVQNPMELVTVVLVLQN
jgi:hypothetical protein